jgi:hypothetical protein
MNRQQIIDEMAGTSFYPVARYVSEPYSTGDGEATSVVSVTIVGRDDIGYTLCTSDSADGPSDDLGDDVYHTLKDAVYACQVLVLNRPQGELELIGEYADAASVD